ncbi:ATP-dependent DNA helicase RecG [Patescibacteria group bacterium]|nr:ATP-dependent DNA helicase RecG [Patescibacteria group bacterium]MBU1931729.1 ATP-dependent DNA helicase RecG [Patescibacteria group bacterium]
MAQNVTLNTPVSDLFMVGQAYAKKLAKLEIHTVKDLLYHFPGRYLDFRQTRTISQLKPGEIITITGKIVSSQNIYTRSRKKIQKIIIQDKSGQIEAVWFNQPFLVSSLKPDKQVCLSGKVDVFGRQLSLVSPEYELFKDSAGIHTGRLVPIYPETRGVSSKWLRSRIAPVLKLPIKEFLPPVILKNHALIGLEESLKQIHFPQDLQSAEQARKRLAFEEMFLIQLISLTRKKLWQTHQPTQVLKLDQPKTLEFIAGLPFKLTSAQKRVIKQILTDLTKDQPMNRLLQGDVGSGKTVVAAMAIYLAWLNNQQAVLMAPTEILAQQHYQTFQNLLQPLGMKIELITGSTKTKRQPLHPTPCDLIIGTHALLHRSLEATNIALVIVDEQHRFGVEQRAQLLKKAGKKTLVPHFLTMTATPIPRTVALTLYGDLELSTIDEMPDNRQAVKTWVVSPHKKLAAYQWIKTQIKKEHSQTFIVCPLIEQSESETLKDVKAATVEFERLKTIFQPLKVDLLHGRLKVKSKKQAIDRFRAGKTHILVSTPVVEVGIDIPNATIMMIETAERFGLAQLHQLRGRVGRGAKQSYCLLFTDSANPQIIKRLSYLEKFHNGARLAEIDLQLRGPGEVYGVKQHGFFKLKLASLNNQALINQTREAAKLVINHLNKYQGLKLWLKQSKILT